MRASFQTQEQKKDTNLLKSKNSKSEFMPQKDIRASNSFHSAILEMQQTYGNQFVQRGITADNSCRELCDRNEPLTALSAKEATEFKPHSCNLCPFHPQRSVKRVAIGVSKPPGGIPLQAKLRIGQPGDVYEQEADRVADMVLQRQCSTPECEEEEMLQVKQTLSPIKSNEDVVGQILQHKGSERALEPETREFMESRFGYDFSDVRIHTDCHAAQTSNRLGAEAFTVGRDVYFGSGKYSPASTRGKKLLGHELTHVVQQSSINLYMVQRLPYDSDYGPSAEHCVIYRSPLAERWFTYSYRNNAWCACQRTPDEPHNNCVRKCLQEKMKAHLERQSRSGRVLPITFPLEADPLCHDMWEQHVECYQECECENEFINYPVFSTMCRMPFPCALVGTSIDWFNACMG